MGDSVAVGVKLGVALGVAVAVAVGVRIAPCGMWMPASIWPAWTCSTTEREPLMKPVGGFFSSKRY